MNTLSYRTIDQNGRSFELLIDGQPIDELIGAADSAIPYWLFKDGVNELPRKGVSDYFIVSVCGCGEYGCGNASCQKLDETDCVVLCDFRDDGSSVGNGMTLRFSRENYDSVLADIEREARIFRQARDRGPGQ